ncbi:MAG: hypothetical protein PHW63_08950 [Alphaproteobacteria bacterium]|nr:hypothetical protein [Alphaproteobacteria bacterium]
MTTNQERAAEVIASAGAICGSDCRRTPADPITDCPRCVWCIGAYTQAIADAGLLMPDMPEPKRPGFWEVEGLEINSVDKDGEVLIEYESDSEYIYGMQTRSLWLNHNQVIAILAAYIQTHQEKK